MSLHVHHPSLWFPAKPWQSWHCFRCSSSTDAERGSSDGATLSGGGFFADVPRDYRIVLPPLQTRVAVLNTVFLHCDVAGRSYKDSDFKLGFGTAGVLNDLKACGPCQVNHIRMATLHSLSAKHKILRKKQLQIKGMRCIVLDSNRAEVRLKIHWVPYHVPDDIVRKALEPYRKVKRIPWETWREDSFGEVESSTRTVRLTLKDGVALERFPHQVRLLNRNALVIGPRHVPMCLRCQRTRHGRRECSAPRCDECRRFGHSRLITLKFTRQPRSRLRKISCPTL